MLKYGRRGDRANKTAPHTRMRPTALGFMFTLAVALSSCAPSALGKTANFANCFIPGEVTEYKVSWMGIPLAWSKSSTETITENGRELIRIRMVSQTYKAYTHIYKVDDVTEVIVDPETALPLRLDLVLNEGSRQKSHLTLFDHANKTATFHDRIAGTTHVVAIESRTQDILSFIYSIRNDNLEILAENVHTVFVDGKIHEMGLAIRKDGQIKLPDYGKIDCSQVEPIAEFDALFLREGKIFFWISKQNRRMVTCVHAKVAVGKISVKLQQVSGPGNDFWVRRKE
ncbi:hypothetical protein PDESU_00615 [Pontiella desulfatans]|uniref:DUF3108 domain-containing protein n=1 Tax=Pontiella desulfatans TaxID=2750659 RepID=A0A6C2TWK5_PONDE|nr:DUF3108 domain-containing protein [Pontiella desulfatans]VGO12065.1 hypothetical protein PDESU_00615 [Pontiella desulfatans]